MTDKEFKQLSRPQLIEIIYQLQLQLDNLNEQNQSIEKELEDKRLRINNAGNLAKAALEINDCFKNAQNAAEHYLNEIDAIRAETEAERQRILAEANAERQRILAETQTDCKRIVAAAIAERKRILADAETDAAAIVEEAKQLHGKYEAAVEAILKEFTQSP